MRKNYFKKLLAGSMSLMMIFGSTLAGFASENTSSDNTVTQGYAPQNYYSNTVDSAETVGDTVKIVFHLTCQDGNYNKYGESPNLYYWTTGDGVSKDFTVGQNTATLTFDESASINKMGFILRWGDSWEHKDYDGDRFIDISDVVGGTVNVYITSGQAYVNVDKSSATKGAKILSAVTEDYKNIEFTSGSKFSDAELNNIKLVGVADNSQPAISSITLVSSNSTETRYRMVLTERLNPIKKYELRYRNGGLVYVLSKPDYYATEEFNNLYTYTGNDLGATWSKGSTTFRVWAPFATDLKVNLYATGTEGAEDLIKTVPMTKDINGTWVATASGDLKNVYYMYEATVDGKVVETIDPYAYSAGVNGKRGMIVDLDGTDPEGWENDENPYKSPHFEDSSLYELHIRDFSYEESSGVSAANRGKYLAFTEKGTTNSYGQKTGMDYLSELGITHVHLLPAFDYASVDETKLDKEQFNWGYDPQNFNLPEGSYSSNPYDGEVRVKEFKQMVKSFHDNGIAVVMDVVYGHVAAADSFSVNVLTPDYYTRPDSNGSWCGNDTATERAMNRKFIIDSMVYWAKEYHVDGFRIDQVGLFDTETVAALTKALQEVDPNVVLYGEGWVLPTVPTQDVNLATQGNASLTPGFGYFNDGIRDSVKGNVFYEADAGYVGGNTACISKLLENLNASPAWATAPNNVVNYNSCHDNFTLFDKLTMASPNASYTDVVKQNNLATAILFTSQGVPFIQAGEEILRSKPLGDGKYEHNSYASSSSLNSIKWDDLNKTEVQTTLEYYKGLMELREAHPAFRMTSRSEISSKFHYVQNGLNDSNGVIAYQIDGGANGDTSGGTFVIFNPSKNTVKVSLPAGEWGIYVQNDKAGTEKLGNASSSVNVSPISCMVLIKNANFATGGGSEFKPTLENGVYFEKPSGWGSSIYAYMWYKSTGERIIGDWPGTKIDNIEGNIYGFDCDIEESDDVMIIFNDNSGNQTDDLVYKKNGYYNEYGFVKKVEPAVTKGNVNVKYVDEDGEILSSKTLSGEVGKSYSTTAVTIDGYTLKTSPSNASGTYTKEDITVTYIYFKNQEDVPLRISASVNNLDVTVGNSVKITANALGGTGSYTYKYVLHNVTTNKWSNLTDYVNSASYEYTPKVSGIYELFAVVKDTAGTVVTSKAIKVTVAGDLEALTITATGNGSTSVNVTAGTKVTVVASATGGTGSYTYKYVLHDVTTNKWSNLTAYGSSSSYIYTPKAAGTYELFAVVQDSAGTVVTSNAIKVTATGNAALAITAKGNGSASVNVAAGTKVTIAASASGGSGSYTYKYVLHNVTTNKWSNLTSYGSSASYAYMLTTAGTYELFAVVKDGAGTVVTSNAVKVTVTGGTAALTISAKGNGSTSLSVAVGTKVTIAASASGGSGNYTYKYVLHNVTTNKWSNLTAYGSSASYTYAISSVGAYELYAVVKDTAGTVITSNAVKIVVN